MRDRPHWSYSAISQYLRCPLQYFFQRVLCLPARVTGSGLALGSAVHSALAEYHRSLQRKIEIPNVKVVDTFRNSWAERETREDIQFKAGESRDETIEQGVHLLETYLKEPPPQQIVSVEQELLVPLSNSRGEYLEDPLIAITDLITTEHERLKVTEFKTSGKAYSESDVGTSLQPTCYVHAVMEAYGQEPTVEYAVLVKTKTPKVQRLSTARDSRDAARLGDLVETVEKGIRLGVFYPVESAMNCSSCSYRRTCREWGRAPSPRQASVNFEINKDCDSCSPNSTVKEVVSVDQLVKASSAAP